MSENQAAVLYKAGQLQVEPYPMPKVSSRHVLVEVRSVGVCGSDVHYYEDGRVGDFVVEAPIVLGHEASGVIVDRALDAARHEIGRRVAIEPGIPCTNCRECRHGRYNLCPDVRFFATPPVDGAFARYVAVHEDFVHPIPDELSDDAGALIEPLSVAVWSNRKAGTRVGSRVLVTGAGPIGILVAQVARASGAAYVAILDVNPDRLRRASELGVDALVDGRDAPDLSHHRPDILLECTGATCVIREGISALVPAGAAVLVGMGTGGDQPLPLARIQAYELIVTATFRYANVYPEAISLAARAQVELDALVGARLPLAHTEAALQMCHTDPAVLKTVVDMTI